MKKLKCEKCGKTFEAHPMHVYVKTKDGNTACTEKYPIYCRECNLKSLKN